MNYKQLSNGDWFTITTDPEKDRFYLLFDRLNYRALEFNNQGKFIAVVKIAKDTNLEFNTINVNLIRDSNDFN